MCGRWSVVVFFYFPEPSSSGLVWIALATIGMDWPRAILVFIIHIWMRTTPQTSGSESTARRSEASPHAHLNVVRANNQLPLRPVLITVWYSHRETLYV